MKAFLSVVIVALLGVCAWIYFTATRPTEAHRAIISGLKAELKESRAEFDRSQEALAIAEVEIESLKGRLASVEAGAVARIFPDGNSPLPLGTDAAVSDAPADSSPPVATSSAKAGTLEGRLSELKAIFESNRLSIENRKDLLEGELASLQARRKSVANTELHFSEQSTRVDVDGFVRGNRGVRTSSADRGRAEAKIADKLAEIDRAIAEKQAARARLVTEMEGLRANYSKAILRAREEFAPESVSSK